MRSQIGGRERKPCEESPVVILPLAAVSEPDYTGVFTTIPTGDDEMEDET